MPFSTAKQASAWGFAPQLLSPPTPRWAVGVVLYQCAVAWVFALIVRLVGLALI